MRLFDPQRLASVLAQQNPVMSGLQGAQQTISTIYRPQQLQAQLQNQLLQNQMNQAKMKTLPDLLQAQLQQAQARVPLTQQQTEATRLANKYKHLNETIQAQNALTQLGRLSQSQSRFGAAYQFAKMVNELPPASKDAFLAKNQEAYNQALVTIGNQIGQTSQTPGVPNLLTNQVLSDVGMQPSSTVAPNTQASVNQASQNVNYTPYPVHVPMANTTVNANAAPEFSTDTQTNSLTKRTTEIAANESGLPQSIKDRLAAGAAIENLLNNKNVQNLMNNVGKYAGFEGGIREQWDKYMNPQAYNNIQSFRDQLGSIMSGSISALEAYGKTIPGLKTGLNYFKLGQKALGKGANQAAIDYFNQGMNLLHAEYQAINKTAHPYFKNAEHYQTIAPHLQGATPAPGKSDADRVMVLDPKGNPHWLPRNQLQLAIQQGYKEA